MYGIYNLYIPVCGLLISLICNLFFFTRPRAKNKETAIFSRELIYSFIDSVLMVIIISIALFKSNNIKLLEYLNKIDYAMYILFTSNLFLYVFYVTTSSDENKKFKLYNIFFWVTTAFDILLMILLLFMKVDVHVSDNALYSDGHALNSTIIGCVIYFVAIIICLTINVKKALSKKLAPLYTLIIFFIFVVLLNQIDKTIVIISAVLAFVNLIMLFTVENPDMKMVNEITLARDQAQRANRAKSDFLSSMSHEIRTPLNAIVGLSEDNLSYENQLPKEVIENSKDIVNASQTLLEIVGNILDINKIEANKMEIIEDIYNFKEEILNMCKVTQTRIGEKNIMFNLSISNDIPYELIGDKGKVKIIINNLLTNAIKYTDAGKIDLNIKCINDLNKNVSNIIVTCQDTGKGIKTELINRLFTKFDRLDVEKNTTIEGTGLGLAITKSLLEMMGGKINVQSQFGKGSIFIVQIPQKINKLAKPMFEKEMEKNCVKVDKIKDANLYRNKKVLVVDDNKLNIKVVMRALKDFNFIFDECYDGRECIEKVNSGNVYDLILMDIMMPNMNGEQAIAELKKISTFNTPVIALTADAITGAKEKYINEGFFDYIAKPFSRDQIKEIIDKIFSSNNFIEKNSQDQQVNENTYLNKNSKYSTGENNVEIDLSKDKNFNIIYDEQYLLNNGVNYKKGLELFGDIDTYKSMLLDWFNESNNKFEKIKFTKLNHDMQNYAVAVHALKSDSKYFGFEKLALIAYEHEMKSKSGDEEYINTNFKFLENEFNKVIIIVGKYLNNK